MLHHGVRAPSSSHRTMCVCVQTAFDTEMSAIRTNNAGVRRHGSIHLKTSSGPQSCCLLQSNPAFCTKTSPRSSCPKDQEITLPARRALLIQPQSQFLNVGVLYHVYRGLLGPINGQASSLPCIMSFKRAMQCETGFQILKVARSDRRIMLSW